MLVEDGDWFIQSLTEDSSNDYRLHHRPSGYSATFDYVSVNDTGNVHLWSNGIFEASVGSFMDVEQLPDEIAETFRDLADE